MSNSASLMSSCYLQQQWWTMLLIRSTSIGVIKDCVQLGPCVIWSSGVSAIQGLLKYWSEWEIVWVSAVEGCPLSGAPL